MNSYERKSAPIRELVQNPDINVMANSLTKGTEGLHHVVPNISQSLQATGTRALNYLHSQMPKASTEYVGDADYEPSKAQQRNWLDLHEIVHDPISILDHVRHGTLTNDHMDALSQVHPELLDDMRQKVMEEMDPSKVKKLSSTTKLSLGKFLGSPVTAAQSPQAVMSNQMALSQSRAPQVAPKTTISGMKDLNLAQRSKTGTENLDVES